MKKENVRCEECNGHVKKEESVYRCIECGVVTDEEGFVNYDIHIEM